jgi:hypothetical protein
VKATEPGERLWQARHLRVHPRSSGC